MWLMENVVEGDEARSQKTNAFKGEPKSFNYAQALRIYHSVLEVKHLQHMSVSGFDIHFWQNNSHLLGCLVVYTVWMFRILPDHRLCLQLWLVICCRSPLPRWFIRTLPPKMVGKKCWPCGKDGRINEVPCAQALSSWCLGSGRLCKDTLYSEFGPVVEQV